MAHATNLRNGIASVLMTLSVLALQSVPLASAQYVDANGNLQLDKGAADKGDKGDDKGKPPAPPEVPESGPGTILALALVAVAGFVTYRKASHA
jgi:hypothetical protein